MAPPARPGRFSDSSGWAGGPMPAVRLSAARLRHQGPLPAPSAPGLHRPDRHVVHSRAYPYSRNRGGEGSAPGRPAALPWLAHQPPRGVPAVRGEDRRVGGPHSARLGRADHARLSLRCGRAAPRLRVRPAAFPPSGLCGESARGGARRGPTNGTGSGDLPQSWNGGGRAKIDSWG